MLLSWLLRWLLRNFLDISWFQKCYFPSKYSRHSVIVFLNICFRKNNKPDILTARKGNDHYQMRSCHTLIEILIYTTLLPLEDQPISYWFQHMKKEQGIACVAPKIIHTTFWKITKMYKGKFLRSSWILLQPSIQITV